MGIFYEKLATRLLFRLDPETAHEHAVAALSVLARMPPLCAAMERLCRTGGGGVECLGLRFPNRVGLAAGFDKNARCWPAAAALGFGHVEVGTITHLEQPGNPRPRLFRYPGHRAVINRMGFNNEGAAKVAARLARQTRPGRRAIPLGINLGKSRAASLDHAVGDYLSSFELLAEHADYLVINVSSPNTPDLRRLQDEDRLHALLGALSEANRVRAAQPGRRPLPLLLKIAPDLAFPQIDSVLGVVAHYGLDGVIATNTTLARPGETAGLKEAGGLSGAPLRARSTEIVRYIARATGGRLPVIASGGVMDEASAAEKLDAGATLVQVYTGWIYRGPFFARDLARSFARRSPLPNPIA